MPCLPQEAFAAFVGIDWADAKHDVCLQAVGDDQRECSRLEHKPEAIDAWARALQERCAGHPGAVCLELNKGPLVYALRQDEFLVLFPVNPGTLAKYRAAFTPSHAQDDPTDAELQLELLLKHRDTLQPLIPQSAAMRALEQLVEHRASWSATTCASPTASPGRSKIISRTPCNGVRITTPHSSVTSFLNGRP